MMTTLTRLELIIASCVYLACRVEGYPRLLDEISLYSGVEAKEIGKMQILLARKLSLTIGIIKPADLVNRMTAQLHFPFEQKQTAHDFCSELSRYEVFVTSPPQLIVAGVLVWVYILLSNPDLHSSLLLSDVSEVCFVPAAAVAKIFRDLSEYLPSIAPLSLKQVLGKYPDYVYAQFSKYLNSSDHNTILSIESLQASKRAAALASKEKKRKHSDL